MVGWSHTLMVAILSFALITLQLAYALTASPTSPVTVGPDPEEIGIYDPLVPPSKIYVASENDDVTVINGATDAVITAIPAGNMPFGVGVNSATNRVYISDVDGGQVFVIDASTDLVIDQDAGTGGDQGILVGANPRGVEVDDDPAVNKVFSANEGDDTVSAIDGAINTVIGAAISVGDAPRSMGVHRDDNKLYVANSGDDTVSVIDTVTNAVIGAPIAVGDSPGGPGSAGGVGVNTATDKAYVCNVNDGTVSVIDTNTDTVLAVPDGAAINVGTCAGIAVNEAANVIYVAGFNVVSVVDGATDDVVDSLAVTTNSRGAAFNSDTGKIYVSAGNVGGEGKVLVLIEQTPEMILKCYPVIEEQPIINPPAVTLVDQFGTEVVDPGSTQRVCEEGLKHSTLAPDNPRHWKQYEYVGTRETGQFELKDQFGTEVVGPTVSFDLLVPAEKNEQSPPNVQHWTSYGISGTIDPSPIQVADQFGASLIDLGNPVSFFSNTFKNGQGLTGGQDMKCYNIDSEDPVIDPTQHAYNDQFGLSIIDPLPADFLCVIAQKSLIPETPVGGELLTVQLNSLFIAGAFANAFWIVPTLAGVIGGAVVMAIIRIRGRKTS